jgi:hypothetical protein
MVKMYSFLQAINVCKYCKRRFLGELISLVAFVFQQKCSIPFRVKIFLALTVTGYGIGNGTGSE